MNNNPCNKPESLTYMGFKLKTASWLDDIPKIQLCPKVAAIIQPYNPEFVRCTNKWMEDFFGTKDEIYLSKCSRTIFAGPKTIARLKQLTDKQIL